MLQNLQFLFIFASKVFRCEITIYFTRNARLLLKKSKPPIKTNPQGQGPRPFPIVDLSSLMVRTGPCICASLLCAIFGLHYCCSTATVLLGDWHHYCCSTGPSTGPVLAPVLAPVLVQ